MNAIAWMLSGLPLIVLAQAGLAQPAAAPSVPAIIPRPASLEPRAGVFALTPGARLVVEPDTPDGERIAGYLADRLEASSGVRLTISTSPRPDAPGHVILTRRKARPELGPEGYELDVTPAQLVIRAPADAGLFHGVQTVLQLLPPAVLSRTRRTAHPPWPVPCLRIVDQPRFAWRGLMVDTSRHFFTKAELLDFIVVMALHKLNTLHWHINDDPGWRIEIRKYPKLTEVGAWRDDILFGLDPNSSTAYDEHGRYGGFYTQDDVREIVAYAAERYITIVPEIEMPAHSLASRLAYPELSCDDPPTATRPIAKHAYCAGKERTFEFLEDVLSEVLPLFPSPIVHIGGDECNKSSWKACPRCQERMRAEGLRNEEELQATSGPNSSRIIGTCSTWRIRGPARSPRSAGRRRGSGSGRISRPDWRPTSRGSRRAASTSGRSRRSSASAGGSRRTWRSSTGRSSGT